MLGFGFVSAWATAWLAAGAVSVSIPILIHLLHKARAPTVPFPTLRFLRSAAEKTARRRRLENLLLLAVRLLLFALLAFALARPFLSREFGLFGSNPSAAACIVLDNSYSMNVTYEGQTRFWKAKKEARAILDSPWRPALAAVLLTNPGALPAPDRLVSDRAKLFRDLDTAQAASGRADLPGTLKAAYALLDKADAADKRLWILTDRQALSWEGIGDLEEPRKHPAIPVAVIRPTEAAYANVAITAAEVVSRSRVVGFPVRIDVTLTNSGPAQEKRNLLLFVDDSSQARQKQAVDLAPAQHPAEGGAPGATRVVAMTHAFDKAGPHRLLVAVEGTDSLAVDNTRRIALQIADRIPVLLVKQAAADIPFQDANFYLVRALDPAGEGADFPGAIRPVETTPENLDPATFGRWDAVFLNDVGALAPATVRAMADYVASGRTLVVFCGPHVVPADYNRLFVDGIPREGGLLPARLKERVGSAVLKTDTRKIVQVQGRSPYLEDLVESADIYQGVLVYEYVRTDVAAADSVLARLSDGDPFLLEKPFGGGRVLLFTAGATTEWTNFPVRNLFLPLMMRIVHLAARGQTERRNILAGQPFETNLYPDVKEAVTVEVAGPLGPAGETVTENRETLPGASNNLLRFDKTWNLGYYAYSLPQRGDVRGVFSTNPDGTESDLAEIADERLAADLGARETHVAASFDDLVSRFQETARRELWQYFLILCLLLAVLEPLLANWMRPEEERSPGERHAPSKLGG
ncbi:MAG: VWA domain-containing protein [Planctomycetota bacterium]|nr:VWA domain-containing protein [Planctomycetota bacterium]